VGSGWQAYLNGRAVHPFDDTHEHHRPPRWGTDAIVLMTIAERFDAALATGKYDALFTTDVEQ
jgi:hypothetical protein